MAIHLLSGPPSFDQPFIGRCKVVREIVEADKALRQREGHFELMLLEAWGLKNSLEDHWSAGTCESCKIVLAGLEEEMRGWIRQLKETARWHLLGNLSVGIPLSWAKRSSCSHERGVTYRKFLSHSAVLVIECCLDCKAERTLRWWYEGDDW